MEASFLSGERERLAAYRLCSSYRGQGLPIADAISEGNVGLMQALPRFEPAAIEKLKTHAPPPPQIRVGTATRACRGRRPYRR
jgi:hypothetical protein